ncbi:hypothetical protein F5884DRAFT_327383 [Xylogone sp. PMI_703]|nr:hypothetical protein F5884DRAFT_327383 [Xylogone sp. PMI_703]
MPAEIQWFPFLDLPPEIRQRIYTLVCVNDTTVSLAHCDAHSTFPLNILLTCHQLYAEVRPVYFSCNSFEITVRRRNEIWDYFLEPAWRDNRRAIRELHLKINRWGPFDFFCDKLVPALQDCILNGHLRIMHVTIRPSDFITWRSLCEDKISTADDHHPLLALKELCCDPYLEHITLVTESYERREASNENKLPEYHLKLQDISCLLHMG